MLLIHLISTKMFDDKYAIQLQFEERNNNNKLYNCKHLDQGPKRIMKDFNDFFVFHLRFSSFRAFVFRNLHLIFVTMTQSAIHFWYTKCLKVTFVFANNLLWLFIIKLSDLRGCLMFANIYYCFVALAQVYAFWGSISNMLRSYYIIIIIKFSIQ